MMKPSGESAAQHHYANPMGISRTGNMQAAASSQAHHSSNSSRIRNFVGAPHLNAHVHGNAPANGNISMQHPLMNNPELMQEAAGEGYIAPIAKRCVAGNS